MLFDDLRGFMQRLDEIGQLKRVDGADWDLEIGTLTELMAGAPGAVQARLQAPCHR